MVIVAQLVRALDCGSRGRGFEPHHSPHLKSNCLFISQLDFFLAETVLLFYLVPDKKNQFF